MSEQVLQLVESISTLTPLKGKMDSIMSIIRYKEATADERLMALGQLIKDGMTRPAFSKQGGVGSFINCTHCNAMELINVNTTPRLDFGPMDMLSLMKLANSAKNIDLAPIRGLFGKALESAGVDPAEIKGPMDVVGLFTRMNESNKGQLKLRLYQALTSGHGVYDHVCTECGETTTFTF